MLLVRLVGALFVNDTITIGRGTMSKISMVMTSNRKELAEEIVRNSSNDELVRFVKDMDMCVQDWDFTRRLCDYFVKEMKIYEKERLEKD
jgi:hypothetical protein